MKRSLLGPVLVVVTLLTAYTASAEEERKTLRYAGTVQEIDAKKMTLVVVKERLELGMLFDASRTQWMNVRGLQDLRPGDRVVVEYDAVKARTIAVSVVKKSR